MYKPASIGSVVVCKSLPALVWIAVLAPVLCDLGEMAGIFDVAMSRNEEI